MRFSFVFFWKGDCNVGGTDREGWEMCEIGVHDAKFIKNQHKV